MNQILDLSAIRFLVVEGNPNMRAIIESILRVLGARKIKTAEDAAEALSILKIYNADIITSEWMMEPLDGIEFTQMIRNAKNSPNPLVPIIMLSGHSEQVRIAEARDSGVTEFVAKPISPEVLYRRIAEIILNPRQFVRNKAFFGPDRRRRLSEKYASKLRRKTDKEALSEHIVLDDNGENVKTIQA